MKLYLLNSPAGYTPPTVRGAWDDVSALLTRRIAHQPHTDTLGQEPPVAQASENTATSPWSVSLLRFVSPPLKAQTITGTLNLMVARRESSTSADFAWHVHAYVTQGDSDTPRGTLLTDYKETTGNEWPTTNPAVGGALASAQSLSSLGVSAGDRIVVELGYVSHNTSTSNFTGQIQFGTTNYQLMPDMTSGQTALESAGFLDFSEEIEFENEGVRVTEALYEFFDDSIGDLRVTESLYEYLEPPGGEEVRVTEALYEYLMIGEDPPITAFRSGVVSFPLTWMECWIKEPA